MTKCKHGRDKKLWCEPCFREKQRKKYGATLHDYCDVVGRGHG